MRYFLMILAVMVASLGINQTASAQACTGFALLQDGDQYVDLGGGRALLDNRCYQRALCIGGTISNLGSNLYGCFVEPECEGAKSLPLNGVAAKNADDSWSVGGTTRVYCSVICPVGATLTKQAGNTYYCKAEAPAYNGVGQLELGDKIWKRAANMWKTEDGRSTYCSVQCPAGSTLTHQSGDTHYCKPNPPVCNGVGQLTAGDEIWKRASNMWKTKDGQNTYCSVKCESGTTLTQINGDTHVCKPNPPVCNGVGQLKSGDEIWKRASNMWKTKDGQNTYCSVKCESGTTLTKKSGDTHVCKPNPPVCNGVGQLKSGDEIWKRASNMWKTKDGQNTYCSVKCESGTTLTQINGDTHVCKPNPPVCNGVGQLKSGDQIWKRASNMWKTKDGSKTYCSVKCESGTTLTKTSGDTHVCKPNPPICNGTGLPKVNEKIWKKSSNQWTTQFGKKTFCTIKCPTNTTLKQVSGNQHVCKANAPACSGVGQLKSGDQIWKRASNMWKTKDGSKTYCSVKCESGTTLTKTSGDTHVCKPNPTATGTCKGQYKTLPGFVQRLAKEGKNVTAKEDISVFYGIKDCYNKKNFNKGSRVRCNNKTFGDPFPGKRKNCFAFAR